MAGRLSDLRYGRIVWAEVKDRRGYRKVRPCIILTPTHEIVSNEPLVLMAVSTTFPDPAPPDHILLPYHPDPRRVRTRLARRSAAVVPWLISVYADEISGVIGDVPQTILREIQARLHGGP